MPLDLGEDLREVFVDQELMVLIGGHLNRPRVDENLMERSWGKFL